MNCFFKSCFCCYSKEGPHVLITLTKGRHFVVVGTAIQLDSLPPHIPLIGQGSGKMLLRSVWPDGYIIFQPFAVYIIKNLPRSIKIAKVGRKDCQIFPKDLKSYKSGHTGYVTLWYGLPVSPFLIINGKGEKRSPSLYPNSWISCIGILACTNIGILVYTILVYTTDLFIQTHEFPALVY